MTDEIDFFPLRKRFKDMKYIFLIAFILIGIACFSQNSICTYKNPEITLAIPISQDFKPTDSVVAFSGFANPDAVFTINYHHKLITDFLIDSNYLKKPYNYFTIKLSTIDTNMLSFYKAAHDQYTEAYYITYGRYAPKKRIDSTEAIELLDGVQFKRTEIIMFDKNKKYFTSGFMYAIYKDYEIDIQYLTLDQETENEINTMLQGLKINN